MWRWAISSNRRGAAEIGPGLARGRRVLSVGVGGALTIQALLVASAAAQVRLNQEEALRLAFPAPATIERRTAFLDEKQLDRARQLAGAGVEVEDRVVSYYVGFRGVEPLGIAYFDAHRVRTLSEVLMIVVTPAARVRRIEVLRFSEPPEYEAPDGWLQQFEGRSLAEGLSLKGSIVNITGATLTSRAVSEAVSEAVRRVLALHRVIEPLPERTEKGEG